MVKFKLSLFGKKKEEEEEKQPPKKTPKKEKKTETPVVVREVAKTTTVSERFRITPKIIFVGSGKGGVGKSFISSNLAYIISAHLKHEKGKSLYAVDLDLDNTTLSMVLPPPDIYAKLKKALATSEINYMNVADILDEGVVTKRAIFSFPVKMFTCGGTQIVSRIKLIPAYHELKQKKQMIRLKELDVLRLREGLNSLIDYLKEKNGVAILDGKQKSNLGINYDPLYKVAKERADVVILVTEPPYMSFSSITAQYKDILSKTIIVVNKMESGFTNRLTVLINDAMRYEVPVFIVPFSKDDSYVYGRKLSPPASRLNSKTARFIGALAMYLNLIENCDTGCCDVYAEILSRMIELMQTLR
jgi:MinD-like ATPase involved in chromosome partitioning or flagellar assembly